LLILISIYVEGVQFCRPSREQAIRFISKILDFDNNSDEDVNDGNQ